MAAGTWTFVNGARQDILTGVLASGSSFKVALVTSAGNVSATSTTFAGVTSEVGTTNTGYTAGGIAVTPVLSGTTSVTFKCNNPQWTAGTANLTAKWAVIYKVASNLLAFVTLDSGGADVTATSGNTLTIDLTTNPVYTLA